MKQSHKLIAGIIFFAGVFGFTLGLTTEAIRAQDDQAPETTENQQQQQQPAPESYVYTAQPGDSYTVLARKAIQTYGIDSQVDLSGAQIVFAETNLTQQAGEPLLLVGQEVTISRTDVEAWVKKAQELSDAAQSRWEPYAAQVDFDTSDNG